MKVDGEKAIPSGGSDLSMGLSERVKITETPEQLGEGRNEDNGKPNGPDKSSASGGFKFG